MICYLKAFFLMLPVFISACTAKPPEIAVSAHFAGQAVNTTVDSKSAGYYLENYLQDSRNDAELDGKIDELYQKYAQKMPDRDELAEISRNFSVDFAALFLGDKLLEKKRNRDAQILFSALLENIAETKRRLRNKNYLLLFVPGWDYQASAHVTGADFAVAREQITALGIENYLLRIPSNGGVEENALYVKKAVEIHGQMGKPIILIGASSANPAIQLALGELLHEKDSRAVRAWMNVGGILQGSPIVDYYQKWLYGWGMKFYCDYQGWKQRDLVSMSTKSLQAAYKRLKLPKHLLVFNYMGLPLSGQLSYLVKDRYLMLRDLGPNDGLTLLRDIIAPDSTTIIAVGSDHFFAQDPEIHLKTIALMQLIVDYLENREKTGGKR